MSKKFALLRKSFVGGFALAALLVANPASAVPVGLELLLLVDVSGSVDAGEYNTQKGGYVSAFMDPVIQANIATITGGIAVSYAEWSSPGAQTQAVGWTHITDAASATAFANAINGVVRTSSGTTAPGSAINWGNPLFDNNGFEGDRLVIDVSGDGQENSGDDTFDAATDAFMDGIVVNGLPIGGAGLQTWYQDNIVTPGGGFLIAASSFQDFEDAVRRKIGREITGVPEPGTLLLMGLGLLGLGFRASRRG